MKHFMLAGYRFAAVLVATTVAPEAAVARADATELDLDACIAQAAERSDAIRSARFRHRAARARASGAEAQRWPTLGALASYDYASEVTSIDIPLGPSPRTIEFGDGNTWRIALGVDVPLYTGGALGAVARAERSGAGAAALDVATDSLAVIRDVRVAFYRTLSSRAQLDAARVAVRRLERHMETVTAGIDIGTASEEERVQITARLYDAEQRMLAAEMENITAGIALGTAIGRADTRVTPRGDLGASLLGPGGPADGAFESRPELEALDARRRESELRARAAFGDLLPSVVASAYMNHGKPGVDLVDNEWMTWASARVSLAWTLFDRGARRSSVDAAQALARAVDATRAAVHRRLEGAYETATVRLEYAGRLAAKAAERVAVERRRLEFVTGRYDQGMATETELLDAHDDLADAEAAEVAATASVRLAESELLYAAGR